jgi:hypothetical protein
LPFRSIKWRNHIGKGIDPRVAVFLAVGQNAHLIGEYLDVLARLQGLFGEALDDTLRLTEAIVHDNPRMQEMTLAVA